MKFLATSLSKFSRPVGGLLVLASLLAAQPTFAQETSLLQTQFKAASLEQAKREPSGLRAAANASWRKMLTELGQGLGPGAVPEGFPFDVKEFSQLQSASLGLAFEVNTTSPQKLAASNIPLEKMLQGNGIWNFVIMVKDRPVALLEMAKIDGRWQAQGAGGAKLAQDVYQAAQSHGGKSAFRFVRIYQATADLLEVQDSQANARYVPLVAARESLQMDKLQAGTSLSGQDVLPSLQEAVRKNLAAQAPR